MIAQKSDSRESPIFLSRRTNDNAANPAQGLFADFVPATGILKNDLQRVQILAVGPDLQVREINELIVKLKLFQSGLIGCIRRLEAAKTR